MKRTLSLVLVLAMIVMSVPVSMITFAADITAGQLRDFALAENSYYFDNPDYDEGERDTYLGMVMDAYSLAMTHISNNGGDDTVTHQDLTDAHNDLLAFTVSLKSLADVTVLQSKVLEFQDIVDNHSGAYEPYTITDLQTIIDEANFLISNPPVDQWVVDAKIMELEDHNLIPRVVVNIEYRNISNDQVMFSDTSIHNMFGEVQVFASDMPGWKVDQPSQTFIGSQSEYVFNAIFYYGFINNHVVLEYRDGDYNLLDSHNFSFTGIDSNKVVIPKTFSHLGDDLVVSTVDVFPSPNSSHVSETFIDRFEYDISFTHFAESVLLVANVSEEPEKVVRFVYTLEDGTQQTNTVISTKVSELDKEVFIPVNITFNDVPYTLGTDLTTLSFTNVELAGDSYRVTKTTSTDDVVDVVYNEIVTPSIPDLEITFVYDNEGSMEVFDTRVLNRSSDLMNRITFEKHVEIDGNVYILNNADLLELIDSTVIVTPDQYLVSIGNEQSNFTLEYVPTDFNVIVNILHIDKFSTSGGGLSIIESVSTEIINTNERTSIIEFELPTGRLPYLNYMFNGKNYEISIPNSSTDDYTVQGFRLNGDSCIDTSCDVENVLIRITINGDVRRNINIEFDLQYFLQTPYVPVQEPVYVPVTRPVVVQPVETPKRVIKLIPNLSHLMKVRVSEGEQIDILSKDNGNINWLDAEDYIELVVEEVNETLVRLVVAKDPILKDIETNTELETMFKYGLITGYEDSTFRGDREITLLEADLILGRYLLTYYQDFDEDDMFERLVDNYESTGNWRDDQLATKTFLGNQYSSDIKSNLLNIMVKLSELSGSEKELLLTIELTNKLSDNFSRNDFVKVLTEILK